MSSRLSLLEQLKENNYGEKHYAVYTYPGAGYQLDKTEVWAYNEQEALDKAVDILADRDYRGVVDHYEVFDSCEDGETVDECAERLGLVVAGNSGLYIDGNHLRIEEIGFSETLQKGEDIYRADGYTTYLGGTWLEISNRNGVVYSGSVADDITTAKQAYQVAKRKGYLDDEDDGVNESNFYKAIFTIDDDGYKFEGYHDPRKKWNGYECPYFEKEVADEMVKVFTKREKDLNMYYDKNKDVYVYDNTHYTKDEETIVTYESETINYNGEDIKVYPIGAGSWMWDTLEEEHVDEEMQKKAVNSLEEVVEERINSNGSNVERLENDHVFVGYNPEATDTNDYFDVDDKDDQHNLPSAYSTMSRGHRKAFAELKTIFNSDTTFNQVIDILTKNGVRMKTYMGMD